MITTRPGAPLTRRSPFGDQSGYTLIELMVAIMIATIVVGAAIGLLEFAQQDVTRVDAQVQIAQKARLALQNLMQELHSGCILPRYVPIRANSTENKIIFVSGTGEGPLPEHVFYREVAYEGTREGSLVEYRKSATIANGKVEVSSEPAKRVVLATHIMPATSPSGSGTVPLFRYYDYYESPAEAGYSPGALNPTPLPVPLTEESAAKVAKVTVAFAVAAEPAQQRLGGKIEQVPLEDSAVYRITPTAAVATPVPEPCE